ncbi:MAG: rod shape-determining protein MreC [Kiritimatiellae bacterium]|nr:rod shape-determining protein MreC [Kiritimatiellia bacterium]
MVRRGGFLIWIVLLAALLAIVNLPMPAARAVKAGVREFLAPLHALIARTSVHLRESLSAIRGIGGLAAENRALQEEMLRLRLEMRALQAAAAENAELRELVGFRQRAGHRLVAAEVIARESSGWWQSLRLDRGRRDGLRPDLPVVTPDGIVGRILDVSDHTADVLLISDPSCRVSVRLPRTDSHGVLRGTGMRWDGQIVCRVDFLHPRHTIRPGDEVVTSGLGGVFPPNLPVGTVLSAQRDASGLYRQAEVLPRADLGRIRRAFVLTDGSSPPAKEGRHP